MKEETKKAFDTFTRITGVEPISARMETGSMRGTVRFRLFWTKELSDFLTVQSFLRENKRNYRGVDFKFADTSDGGGLGNEWHKHHGFGVHVELEELFKNQP